MSAAVEVAGLRKAYSGVEAVRGVDFEIHSGEVFGLLGPNGAGKTTTVEILEGYRPRDGGEVQVLGVDPWRADAAHRARIGVVLQHSELPPTLSVREVHRMFAGYYERPRDIDEVIELVGLGEEDEVGIADERHPEVEAALLPAREGLHAGVPIRISAPSRITATRSASCWASSR